MPFPSYLGKEDRDLFQLIGDEVRSKKDSLKLNYDDFSQTALGETDLAEGGIDERLKLFDDLDLINISGAAGEFCIHFRMTPHGVEKYADLFMGNVEPAILVEVFENDLRKSDKISSKIDVESNIVNGHLSELETQGFWELSNEVSQYKTITRLTERGKRRYELAKNRT